ncbi:phage tail tape measure protein [Psychrobacillus psychrodurans]|uniref:phage tail tape measure protein n=1 Tax=Psychrobacillus psychrodurans TaxID=126157 RepID=UPI001F4F07C3|nr:phage tail tape measure protein [Psychrobacillus psychrodurans]MCK1997960.1 phage tail tape measure protein [Psychrobacillus psychrodurans]
MNDSIIVQVGANISQFQNAINQVSGDLRNVGNNMTTFGTSMAKGFGAATLAVGTGLGFVVKQAADFDTEMRKAGAIAGASAKELDAMKASALELGASTSESASSVATAKHTWSFA